MDINPFIQTAFGAIVGGGVVVATNWLSTQREKRKAIQEWYEQRYITEGVDCLISYFTNVGLRLFHRNDTLSIPDNPVPVEALTRIEYLLGMKPIMNGGMEAFTILLAQFQRCLDREFDVSDPTFDALWQLFDVLFKLRQELLTQIPNKIKRKSQRLELSNYGDRIVNISLILEDKLSGGKFIKGMIERSIELSGKVQEQMTQRKSQNEMLSLDMSYPPAQ